MRRRLPVVLCLLLAPLCASAADRGGSGEEAPKELSGMSIVGNDEAPKSLYIVPWKSSEIGVETSLDLMLETNNVLVDPDVFKRQLDFYEASQAHTTGR